VTQNALFSPFLRGTKGDLQLMLHQNLRSIATKPNRHLSQTIFELVLPLQIYVLKPTITL
jgi:hypothetical protein